MHAPQKESDVTGEFQQYKKGSYDNDYAQDLSYFFGLPCVIKADETDRSKQFDERLFKAVFTSLSLTLIV